MDSTLNVYEEMTAPSILSLFETSKEQRQSFVVRIVEALESGQAEPLKIHLQVKAMEEIINTLTSRDEKKNKDGVEYAKKYHKMLLDAAEKYGKKFEYQNSKIEIKEVGTKYDYSQCNDPVIASLHAKAAELKKEIEARESLLKTLPQSGMIVTDEATGETYSIYPAAKTSTTSVAVSLK